MVRADFSTDDLVTLVWAMSRVIAMSDGDDTRRRRHLSFVLDGLRVRPPRSTSIPYLETMAGPQLIGLSPHAGGGVAERMNVQEHRLIPVPEDVVVEHMAIAEPLAVGVHSVEAATLRDVDIALVIGCGPVGLAVIASLNAGGHGPVITGAPRPPQRPRRPAAGAYRRRHRR